MDIELFVGGCVLCKKTEKMVKSVMGPRCRLRVYNLAEEEGMKEARRHGIRAVPTIVGNGQKMFEGLPEYRELVGCSLKHGCKGRLLE